MAGRERSCNVVVVCFWFVVFVFVLIVCYYLAGEVGDGDEDDAVGEQSEEGKEENDESVQLGRDTAGYGSDGGTVVERWNTGGLATVYKVAWLADTVE